MTGLYVSAASPSEKLKTLSVTSVAYLYLLLLLILLLQITRVNYHNTTYAYTNYVRPIRRVNQLPPESANVYTCIVHVCYSKPITYNIIKYSIAKLFNDRSNTPSNIQE